MAVCPTANKLDGVALTTVNTPPETVAPEIFTTPVPVFVTVTLCVAVLPSTTFPNPMLLEDALRVPPPEPPVPPPLPPDAALVYPAHPARLTDAISSNNPANDAKATLFFSSPAMWTRCAYRVPMTRNTVCVCDVAALLDVRREKGRRKKLFDGRRVLFLRHVPCGKYSCTKLGIGTVESKEKTAWPLDVFGQHCTHSKRRGNRPHLRTEARCVIRRDGADRLATNSRQSERRSIRKVKHYGFGMDAGASLEGALLPAELTASTV